VLLEVQRLVPLQVTLCLFQMSCMTATFGCFKTTVAPV
jgi:hypothetical protein